MKELPMASDHKGPNAIVEPNSENTWRIPIAVTRTESTFVVVRLRADSFSEAFERARETIDEHCREQSLELDAETGLDFDVWSLEHYEQHGLEKNVSGAISDYAVDFDITEQPTRAEARLAEAQLDLPLPPASEENRP